MNPELQPIPDRRFVKIIDFDIFEGPIYDEPDEWKPEWRPNPIYIADQENGVFLLLHSYLKGRIPFEKIPPFLIREPRGDQKGGERFFIGGRIRGKLVTFSLNENIQKILKDDGVIVAIPHQDENNLYQWIDFHELGLMDVVDLKRIVQSFRIDTQKLKMESWGGFERQMFLDYLGGRNEIDANLLREFWMWNYNQSTDSFQMGTINGKNVEFSNKNILTSSGKGLVFQPKIGQSGNTYLEIFSADPEGEEILIDRRIFRKGDHKLYRITESTISPDEANEALMKFLET